MPINDTIKMVTSVTKHRYFPNMIWEVSRSFLFCQELPGWVGASRVCSSKLPPSESSSFPNQRNEFRSFRSSDYVMWPVGAATAVHMVGRRIHIPDNFTSLTTNTKSTFATTWKNGPKNVSQLRFVEVLSFSYYAANVIQKGMKKKNIWKRASEKLVETTRFKPQPTSCSKIF